MADTSIYTDPSNMDKANVQLCIWNGTKWVELSNGYTINQINTNIHEIADKVAEAQQGIAQATTDAQNAVDTANNAITKAGFATDTATTAKQVADTANSVATQAQSDIATAKSNITTVSNDLATAKTNITNNTNAISDAKGNISSLQSSSSKLESDMTDAKGNISTLQQDSTSFKSEIGNLQSDNSTNKSNISSLQQTANGLTSTVASVQTQVNNSAVGTNLLLNTKNFDSSIWFNKSSEAYYSVDEIYQGLSVFEGSNAWNGIYQHVWVTAGQTLTFSIFARSTDISKEFNANFYPLPNPDFGIQSASVTSSYDSGLHLNESWDRFTFTFTVVSEGYICPRVEKDSNNGWLRISGMKLEKGTTATDYSANPADNATVTALSSVKQEADSISSTVTTNKASSDSQFSTINQTISGIQSTVSNKADSSTVTQLSNLVNTKVNSSGYNSEITQLSSDINLRVKTGDLLSQINIESGNTLIQSNKIYLDASSVVFGGTAFINSAMISSISADDITTGTMTAGAINLGNGTFKVDVNGNLTANNATITGGSLKVGSNFNVNTSGILTANGATINGNLNVNSSGNLTTIDSNGFHNYDGKGNDIYIKNGTFKSTMYDEAYNATTSIEVQEGKLVAAYNDENISIYVGRQTAPVILWSDGSQIESSSGSLAVNSNKDMQFSSSSGNVNFSSPSNTNINFQPNGGGGVVFGSLANFTKNAIVGADQSGDQIWVRGAGNFNGKVSCQSLTQTSLLSKKTNITKLNIQDVINAINSTEIYEYSFKRDLEQGVNKRYASYIIDDVNEVAQYKEPSEFLSDDKQGRDDGTQLAYLTLMVQEMYKEIQELKNK